MSACKPKGHWFHSQSEHMPGLQARSPFGACARGNRSVFRTSMFPSLLLPPSLALKNKILKKKIRQSRNGLKSTVYDRQFITNSWEDNGLGATEVPSGGNKVGPSHDSVHQNISDESNVK